MKIVYSGEQLAMYMPIVLNKYFIQDRFGYFIINNATNNDCIVLAILDQLFETIKVDYNA